ncbi:MAG: InlB B-repeat-containing protein, partial [Firmicutes bacterium]|nr:InlB B-repeat-containing protein [Bacillota bacterium]
MLRYSLNFTPAKPIQLWAMGENTYIHARGGYAGCPIDTDDIAGKYCYLKAYYGSGERDFIISRCFNVYEPCTVTFNANGGSGTMEDITVKKDGAYKLPECDFTAPTNTGFYKWRINGKLYSAGEEVKINDNTVLYATWYVKEVKKEVTAPTIGATPVNTVQNYTYTVNGETVTLNDYSTVLTSGYNTPNAFEANNAYTITVYLSINGNEYYYSDDTKYYINGELAILDNEKSSIKTAYLTYTFPRLTYGGLKYDTDNSVFEVDGTIKLDDYVCASVAEDISEKSDSAMESYLDGDYHYEWYAGNDLLYTGTSDTDTSFKVPKSASGRKIYAVLTIGDQTAQSEEVAIPVYYCTVSFNGNGQAVNINSQNIGYGSFASEPQNPEIEGYIFGGWFTDANCNNKFDFTAPITDNTELFAKWTEITYTVSFNTNGLGENIPDQTVKYNNAAAAPVAPTETGYTFGGWFTDPTYTTEFNFSTPITADTVVYAKWTAEKYTVSFNGNGQTITIGSQTVEYGKTATEPTAPTITGLTFGGWYTDEACKSKFDFATPITGKTVLYAKWTTATYTVTFSGNGKSINIAAQTVEYNNKATEPNAPIADGFTFGGWYVDKECLTAFDFNTPIAEDTVIYAKWTAKDHKVTFDNNGHGEEVELQNIISGNKAVKPSDLTETGYIFGGWYTDKAFE